MNKMQVLMIEDKQDDVKELVQVLRSTGLIELTPMRWYSELGDDTDSIRNAVSKFDLLIFDILMGMEKASFMKVVRAIGGFKPFITYTQLTEKFPLSEAEDVREFVFSHGALALITKSFRVTEDPEDPRGHSQTHIHYMVVEKVLSYYWMAFR